MSDDPNCRFPVEPTQYDNWDAQCFNVFELDAYLASNNLELFTQVSTCENWVKTQLIIVKNSQSATKKAIEFGHKSNQRKKVSSRNQQVSYMNHA